MNVSMKREYHYIACPPENIPQKMALNNQADKMTWPMGNGQPLSPAAPTLPQWVYDEEHVVLKLLVYSSISRTISRVEIVWEIDE